MRSGVVRVVSCVRDCMARITGFLELRPSCILCLTILGVFYDASVEFYRYTLFRIFFALIMQIL